MGWLERWDQRNQQIADDLRKRPDAGTRIGAVFAAAMLTMLLSTQLGLVGTLLGMPLVLWAARRAQGR